MMTELNGRDIPKLTASLELATASESLASQGPMLLASPSADILKDRSQRMRATHKVAVDKLDAIAKLGADKTVVTALGESVKNIEDTIRSLGAATQEKIDAATQHEKLYNAVRAAAENFVNKAAPSIADAQTGMDATLRAVVFSAEDSGEASRIIVQVGNVVADTNLISSDLMGALSAGTGEALSPIEDSFKTAQKRVKDNLAALDGAISSIPELRKAAGQLLALGDGKDGVFKVRQKEIDTLEYGALILDETRKLNAGLGSSVKQLVDNVRTETDAATAKAQTTIALSTQIMLALGALTLIGSALFVWLYVGRSILRRIAQLQQAMQLLSSGDLETRMARSKQQDEITVMADSLEVFRETMISARTMSAEQDRDRLAKNERAAEAADCGRLHAEHRAGHVVHRRSLQRPGQCGRSRGRGDLGERADGVGRHRGADILDLRDQPSGHQLLAARSQSGQRGRHHRCDHAGPRRKCHPHQRRHRSDPDHRLADQPARAQRHHRGRARRRCRPWLCGGRIRGESAVGADRESDGRNCGAGDADADRHGAIRRSDQGYQQHDRPDF
jgi:HAMP domain-containing protein